MTIQIDGKPCHGSVFPRPSVRRPYVLTLSSFRMRTTWRTQPRSLWPYPGTEVGTASPPYTGVDSRSPVCGARSCVTTRLRPPTPIRRPYIHTAAEIGTQTRCRIRLPARCDPTPLSVQGTSDWMYSRSASPASVRSDALK